MGKFPCPMAAFTQRRGLRPLRCGLRGARLRYASADRTPASQWLPKKRAGNQAAPDPSPTQSPDSPARLESRGEEAGSAWPTATEVRRLLRVSGSRAPHRKGLLSQESSQSLASGFGPLVFCMGRTSSGLAGTRGRWLMGSGAWGVRDGSAPLLRRRPAVATRTPEGDPGETILGAVLRAIAVGSTIHATCVLASPLLTPRHAAFGKVARPRAAARCCCPPFKSPRS